MRLVETAIILEQCSNDSLALRAFSFVIANIVRLLKALAEKSEVPCCSMGGSLWFARLIAFSNARPGLLTNMLDVVIRGLFLETRMRLISLRFTRSNKSFVHSDGGWGWHREIASCKGVEMASGNVSRTCLLKPQSLIASTICTAVVFCLTTLKKRLNMRVRGVIASQR